LLKVSDLSGSGSTTLLGWWGVEMGGLLQELELVKQENSQLSSYKRQVLMLDQEKKDLETQLVQVKVSFVLECVGHFFAYVAHFVFLRNVWIRTQRDAVASRCATKPPISLLRHPFLSPFTISHPSPYLAIHPSPYLATHLPT
jgi:hypothetical protein